MDRDAWIMAAWLLEKYGVDALAVIEKKLTALQRNFARGLDYADGALTFSLWRQTGWAVLEIVKDKPGERDQVH